MPYADKEKQAQYCLLWLKKRRKAWFKENGPCVKCKSNKRLQLDHVDPLQKISHKVWSWSAKRRLAELSKCQVLCYKCHKEKSKTELFLRKKRKSGAGKSKFKGVHWHPESSRWRAKITVQGKQLYLGFFKVEEDAARAYDKKVLEVAGVRAVLNFPKGS